MHRDRLEAVKDHIGFRPRNPKEYPSVLAHAYDDIVWLVAEVERLRRLAGEADNTYTQQVTFVQDGLRYDSV